MTDNELNALFIRLWGKQEAMTNTEENAFLSEKLKAYSTSKVQETVSRWTGEYSDLPDQYLEQMGYEYISPEKFFNRKMQALSDNWRTQLNLKLEGAFVTYNTLIGIIDGVDHEKVAAEMESYFNNVTADTHDLFETIALEYAEQSSDVKYRKGMDFIAKLLFNKTIPELTADMMEYMN